MHKTIFSGFGQSDLCKMSCGIKQIFVICKSLNMIVHSAVVCHPLVLKGKLLLFILYIISLSIFQNWCSLCRQCFSLGSSRVYEAA